MRKWRRAWSKITWSQSSLPYYAENLDDCSLDSRTSSSSLITYTCILYFCLWLSFFSYIYIYIYIYTFIVYSLLNWDLTFIIIHSIFFICNYDYNYIFASIRKAFEICIFYLHVCILKVQVSLQFRLFR